MSPETPAAAAYEALIEFLYQAPIGLVQTTLEGEITLLNPKSAQMLMPLVEDGNLGNLFEVLADMAPDLRRRVRAHGAEHGPVVDGLRLAAPARRGQPAQVLSLSLLRLRDATLMASLSDVTAEVQREEQHLARQLDKAARTDPLTAMPNRAAVIERLSAALASSTSGPCWQGGGGFALLFLNADRFARINDTHGTLAGDELLRQMASRLNGLLRAADRFARTAVPGQTAARLGGDEFVVLLEGLRSPGDAVSVAERLTTSLCGPYRLGSGSVHATVSIGVVLQGQAGPDADALLQCASTAMQEAKRRGGNRCCLFEPEMQAAATRRGALEAELRTAVARQEFFVAYQPIVGLQDGAVAGMEALVRWQHPRRGIVPPVEFIPVAEECGLIGAIGALVLEQACAQHVRWQQALGAAAPQLLSVNLSRAQLAEAALAGQVAATLQHTGMPPQALQLEITESLAAQDDQVQRRLHELKALGLTLALDDFGTGYSSLSSLHLLPVDVVKIDRSFVSQAGDSAHHRVLIEATVRVARSLGMKTVAEGVETEEQAGVLRGLGCDKGQGYLFGRPMAAEPATSWLKASATGKTAAPLPPPAWPMQVDRPEPAPQPEVELTTPASVAVFR